MGLHARQFGHPLQRGFPPAAAHVRHPKGLDQPAGFPVDALLGGHQRVNLLAQLAIGILTGAFHGPGIVLVALEGFLQRFQHAVHGLGALVQIAARPVDEAGQRGLGQVHKDPVVLLEGLSGQPLVRIGQAALPAFDQAELFFERLAVLPDDGFEARPAAAKVGYGLLQRGHLRLPLLQTGFQRFRPLGPHFGRGMGLGESHHLPVGAVRFMPQ